MSIHKVTNIFVGNGTALEANVSTLTPGKLGVFGTDQNILASAYSAGGASESIQFSETYADGTFKKSMWVNGTSVTAARSERYAPATREVWAIGYNRKTATGSIEVTSSSLYSFYIKFINDKALYSERPERFTVNFTSSSTATQLSIATQAAAAINNGAYKSQIIAVVVGDGTGIYGLTGATNYGVEITPKDINQFQTSTYRENRVVFAVFVDDSSAFGDTTTCTQIQANSFGTGTYNSIYNKENFEYQYEGLSNRRLWPAQVVKFNVSGTGYLSSAIVPTVTGVVGEDTVTFSASVAAILRVGELVELNGNMYEIKYFISNTVAVLTTTVPAIAGGSAVKVKCFYSVIVLEFADNKFTTGADLISQARKSIYIATPAIDAGSAYNSNSTEATSLLSKLNTWLAATPAAPATLSL